MAQLLDERVVENLMDAMVYTQPDIAQVSIMNGRFRENPWNVVKWIMRYLKESRYIRTIKFEHGLTEVNVFRW